MVLSDSDNLERLAHIRLVRLNALVQGVAVGAVTGLGVFVATVWLLLKGGTPVGPHLALLGQYFLGYSVSWSGSIVGLLWGFGFGFAIGGGISMIYNRITTGR